MKHTVRAMGTHDLKKVSQLLRDAYGYLADREGFTEEERERLFEMRGSEEALADQMRAYKILLLEREGVLAGVLAMQGNEIAKLFVDPEHVGTGIGRILFEMAVRFSARSGHDDVIVGSTPHGAPFYETMGMMEVERLTATEGPLPGREIVILRKPLHMLNTTRKLRRETDMHL